MSVSLSPIGGAGWQFFTDDGIPLSGGKIYSYTAGTTVPAATYVANVGVYTNTNPIILDSAGRPPAEVWLTDGIIYKFVVKTSDDILIRTYDNISGIASPSLIASLSGPTGAALVGYSEGSGGAVTQTVQSRLRNDWVVPEDFGAVGNGVTNDTIALQNAFASGKDVLLTANKIYLHTTALSITTDGQRVMGGGILKTSGAINSIEISAEDVELDVIFNSPGQTAGWAIYAVGANRCKIHRVIMISGYGAVYVEQTNTFLIDYIWSTGLGPGIKWFGNDTKRSDIFAINTAYVNPGNAEYGLDWDGNCQGLYIAQLLIIGAKGAVIQNTSGSSTTRPTVGRISNIEISSSSTYGVDIQEGQDFDFVAPRILNCADDGFNIAAGVGVYQVRISGGRITGNTGYGINNAGSAVLVSGSINVSSNTLGSFNGDIRGQAPRFDLDTNYYLNITSNTPRITMDDTDYLSYDRTANKFNFQVAGAGKFSVGPDFTQSLVPDIGAIYTVATLPAGVNGMRAFVSDSSVTIFNDPVAGGGGAAVPVFYASGWKVG